MTPSPPGRIFPTTQHSIIQAVGDADPVRRQQALDTLISVYWRPAYLHLRLKWGHDRHAAEDLTQEFFARTLEGGFFERFDPARARFRTFLRTAIDHLAANQRRDQARRKRGGAAMHLSLDFDGAEQEIGAQVVPDDPDERFHREWIRSLFTMAVAALRAECADQGHDQRFRLFQRCDLDPAEGAERPSYKELAAEFKLPVTQVTNHLAWARREFRRLVLERLQQLSGSEAEYRSEARELFGVDPA
jgi:RNA polymerase sigma factor (sigma-70 family)